MDAGLGRQDLQCDVNLGEQPVCLQSWDKFKPIVSCFMVGSVWNL